MAARLTMVECLSCGHRRTVPHGGARYGPDDCPRCGYVGWASSDELSESTRRLLRDLPVDRRRLRLV